MVKRYRYLVQERLYDSVDKHYYPERIVASYRSMKRAIKLRNKLENIENQRVKMAFDQMTRKYWVIRIEE